jgi:uncharacterized protein (DUF1330 family)
MSDGVRLAVHIWLRDGNVEAFEAYERKVAAILGRHGGRIERAIRCTGAASEPAAPFEIHLVSFPDRESFAAYRADPALRALAAERERIVAKTWIVEGIEVPAY